MPNTKNLINYCIISRTDEISEKVKKDLLSKIKCEYNDINPDLVIAVGGDGTILRTIQKYPNSVIFGIHTGHLGFYTNYSVDDVDLVVEEINSLNYKFESFDMLTCEAKLKNGEVVTHYALNEFTVLSPIKTLILDIYIDGRYLEKYRGTGLCISTTTGSTAYNKAVGGAVLDSNLKAIQLSEIAGINSNAFRTLASSLVLNDKRRITLKPTDSFDIYVTYDNLSFTPNDLEELNIFYSGEKVKMAYNNKEDFMTRINRSFLISKD